MSNVLADVGTGSRVRLVSIPDGTARTRLLRLGFLDGCVECRHHVRKGPVVLRRNGTDIALGASLAEQIEVERANEEGA